MSNVEVAKLLEALKKITELEEVKYGSEDYGWEPVYSQNDMFEIAQAALASPSAVSDDMAERAHKALMSELFLICQPDRGDVFGFMDDHPEVLRAALSAALPQPVGVDALVSMLERRDADDIPPSREERAFIVKALRTRATTAAQPSAVAVKARQELIERLQESATFLDQIYGVSRHQIAGYVREAIACLSTLAPSAEAAKPVAWHCVGSGLGWHEDKIIRDEETAIEYAKRPADWSVKPLVYALSQPQGELQKALDAIQDEIDKQYVQGSAKSHESRFVADGLRTALGIVAALAGRADG